MRPDQINILLRSGIEAARNGDQSQARESLLAVVDADQENEEAWLWLSSVVDSDEDRRVCLENVLVINPDNAAAKRGLQRLNAIGIRDGEVGDEFTVRRQYDPVSPAASILYPDHNVKEWRWREPAIKQRATNIAYQGQSSYDDVWEREGDICPYCAAELAYDEWRCPNCKRNLKKSYYRYPKPGSDLLIFLILVLGVAQLSFLLILMNLVIGESLLALIWQSLVFISMIVLAAGIYLRRFWSYLGSIIGLIMVLITLLISIFVQPETPGLLDAAITEGFFKALADNPYVFAVEPFIDLVIPLQLLAVILALLYALFRVGPDFERVTVRRIAQISKGVSGASMFHAQGNDYAGQNMWATAVLHYRRAAALEPTRTFYLSALGDGYARLGYYQRSLDVLESAYQLAIDEQKRRELAGVISEVRRQQDISRRRAEPYGQAVDNGE
jgi:tetratricopeptide (TPR) repeat protein